MPLLRLGQAIRKDINRGRGEVASMNATDGIDISAPQNPRRIGRAMDRQAGVRSNDNLGGNSQPVSGSNSQPVSGTQTPVGSRSAQLQRTIRFPDEAPPSVPKGEE